MTLATEAPTQRTRSEGLADFPFVFPPFARQLWLTRLGVAPSCSLEVFALGRSGCQGGAPTGGWGGLPLGSPPAGEITPTPSILYYIIIFISLRMLRGHVVDAACIN